MQDDRLGPWNNSREEILKAQYPLHLACRDGDCDWLSELLEAGHDPDVEDAFYGWMPAHWAAYFGKLSCLKCLEERSICCDIPVFRFNQTPLHIAAYANCCHCLQWLLSVCAQKNKQLACLRRLIQSRFKFHDNVDMVTSGFGQTVLHMAAYASHPHCMHWLLEASANISAQDYLGETPLHKACRAGGVECVSQLIAAGAKLDIKNVSANTPAELARNCGFHECALLIEQRSQAAFAQRVTPNHVPAPPSLCDIQNGISTPTALSTEMPADEETMDMDSEITATPVIENGAMNGMTHASELGDVTLDHGVRDNIVPIAGKKRCREDEDQPCWKRVKHSGDVSSVFSLTNGHTIMSSASPQMNGHGDGSEQNHFRSVVHQNGFGKIQSSQENLSTHSNGLRGFFSNKMPDDPALFINGGRAIPGAINGHFTYSSHNGNSQNGEQCNDFMMDDSATDVSKHYLAYSSWQCGSVVQPLQSDIAVHTNGYHINNFNLSENGDNTLSTSALEHQNTIILQQGYDSLVYTSAHQEML